QHPTCGSAIAWDSGAEARAHVEGRAIVSGACRRDAASNGSARTAFAKQRHACAATASVTTTRDRTMMRPKGLGRGLDALLAGVDEAAPSGETLRMIAVDRVRPGKYQPRSR